LQAGKFLLDFAHAFVEVHAVILHGRHAHVGAWRQAPGAFVGGRIALNILLASHLAQTRHVGVLAFAEFLYQPHSFADFGSGGFKLCRHRGKLLAVLFLLTLGQRLNLSFGIGLLNFDSRKHGGARGCEILNAAYIRKPLRSFARKQHGKLGAPSLVSA